MISVLTEQVPWTPGVPRGERAENRWPDSGGQCVLLASAFARGLGLFRVVSKQSEVSSDC